MNYNVVNNMALNFYRLFKNVLTTIRSPGYDLQIYRSFRLLLSIMWLYFRFEVMNFLKRKNNDSEIEYSSQNSQKVPPITETNATSLVNKFHHAHIIKH